MWTAALTPVLVKPGDRALATLQLTVLVAGVGALFSSSSIRTLAKTDPLTNSLPPSNL